MSYLDQWLRSRQQVEMSVEIGPFLESNTTDDSSGPEIEGISSYKGTLAHSANWDTSVDWKDKKVAVIGTGSSSIQMVPHLADGEPHFETRILNCTFPSNPRYRSQGADSLRSKPNIHSTPGGF